MNALKRLVAHVIRERDALEKQIYAWEHSRGWKFDGCDPPEVGSLPESEWQDRKRWSRDLDASAPESLTELIATLNPHEGFTDFDKLDRDVISTGMKLNLGVGVEADLNDLRRARYGVISAVCDMMTSNQPSLLLDVESFHSLNEALTRLMRRVPAFEGELPAITTPKPEAASTVKSSNSAKPKKPTLNARMIDTLAKRPESKDWTIAQFVVALGCRSKSGVHATPAWKKLVEMRAAEAAKRHGRESFRDARGKRKSRTT